MPVIANLTAAAVSVPETIRALLVDQFSAMVRWRESVLYLKAQGVDTLVEIGAGRILTGLTRRIDRELEGISVQEPGDVEALLKRL